MMMTNKPEVKIKWYYYMFFWILYVVGINVMFTRKMFFSSFCIKAFWLYYVISMLIQTSFTFAEGFIFGVICFGYLLHFFDIFCLFFCSIFIPNGHTLLKD